MPRTCRARAEAPLEEMCLARGILGIYSEAGVSWGRRMLGGAVAAGELLFVSRQASVLKGTARGGRQRNVTCLLNLATCRTSVE